MEIPSYFLPRPRFDLTLAKQTAFETLWQSTPPGGLVDYHLAAPKWQYLCYLCETKELVLHGSQNLTIDIVQPRQARDVRAFSNQNAIYATTDGIWVMYFAILDRDQYPGMSLFNSCLRFRMGDGQLSDNFYFFSISHYALLQKPWCDGMIYILPRQNFTQEAPQHIRGVEVVFPHWIGTASTEPVAKLRVKPEDFPFLGQIHGHNDDKLIQLFTSRPDEFPIGAIETA